MNRKRTALTFAAAAAALVLGTAAAAAAEAASTTSLNVRSGPGAHYRAVDVLRPGELVDVDRCLGSWCHITHPGPDGWVSANYLTRGMDRWNGGYHNYAPPPRPPFFPYHRHHRPFYHPYSSFCVGGKNASFCVGGY